MTLAGDALKHYQGELDREKRAEACRRAAASSARLSGMQVAGSATIKWDHRTALTDPQYLALRQLARGLRDGDLIEYGAADIRMDVDDAGDLIAFVTEAVGGRVTVYNIDEEGGLEEVPR